jgi:tetratricopeptide (TPR) repeat protein
MIGLLVLAPGCRFMYPEPEPEIRQASSDGPMFKDDPAFYAKNAKDYFAGGSYGKARDQWNTQLEIQPDNQWAELGIAYCDYYLGRQATLRADLEFARDRLAIAEEAFRELWDGEIPPDTYTEDTSESLEWRAALGLAMTLRGLGNVNGLESQLQKQRLAALGPQEVDKAREIRGEIEKLRQYRSSNYGASVDLFERLVAMENASPEAIKHLADLYLVLERDDDAERQYRHFLELGRETWLARKQLKEELATETGNEVSIQEAARFIDEKLDSNVRRRVEVMVNLAGIHWSKKHFAKSLEYLYEAQKLDPDRVDLLIKIAQCEGELGLYESAIDHLDDFIVRSGTRDEDWTDNLGEAYRMRREFEARAKDRKEKAQ